VVAAAVGVWGVLQYTNFSSVRSQSGSPSTAPTYANATSAQSAAKTGVPVSIAAAAVAVGLGVGAGFTW
jgi:hypothetical protein